MNKVVLGAIVILSTGMVLDSHAAEPSKSDMCHSLEKHAVSIMNYRQRDLPISGLMDIANKMSEETQAISKSIIIAAYEHPAYQSEEYKQRAIRSFANEIATGCYKNL